MNIYWIRLTGPENFLFCTSSIFAKAQNNPSDMTCYLSCSGDCQMCSSSILHFLYMYVLLWNIPFNLNAYHFSASIYTLFTAFIRTHKTRKRVEARERWEQKENSTYVSITLTLTWYVRYPLPFLSSWLFISVQRFSDWKVKA